MRENTKNMKSKIERLRKKYCDIIIVVNYDLRDL